MKRTISIFFCIVTAGICMLCGCSGFSTEESNVISFDLEDISDVSISYDEEEVTFYQGDGHALIVKEYMTDHNSRYFAKTKQTDSAVYISEGEKPLFKNSFSRYIEVYLPASYHKNLTVTNTNGAVNLSNIDLKLTGLRLDTTEGTVSLRNASADSIHLSSTRGHMNLGTLSGEEIRLETTSGNLSCQELSGKVTYTSTSGGAEIKSAIGSGSYQTENSGVLNICYTQVDDDLYCFNKNGDILLHLPEDLSFEFESITKNGTVSVPFKEKLSVKENTWKGSIGAFPRILIKLESRNGAIKVEN